MLLTIVTGLGIAATWLASQRGQGSDVLTASLFEHWKIVHDKVYPDQETEQYRLSVFRANYGTIMAHNADPAQSYTLGLTKFADLTEAEFAAIYLTGLSAKSPSLRTAAEEPALTGASVDWVAQGYTTGVKDQGQCGSCWAFSTTGGLEALSKKTGPLMSFSEQQLVDCSGSYGNMGCNGGLMTFGYSYVRDKGIITEDSYPYTAVDGSCRTDGGKFKIKSYVEITNCNTLATALTAQVVSVAVDASKWGLYSGGVFKNCGNALNHGVTLVGMTDDYWWIKNSWSTGWGEKGYIKLARGNTCGVCSMASYPV